MARLYQVPIQNALQYTLDTGYTSGGGTLTLNSSLTGIIQAPGVCVVDRIDSSGNLTATKRDYYTFTGVSGQQLTGCVGGLAGSTNQDHSVGAIVEFIPDITWAQAVYDVITQEHSVTGQHTSLASLSQVRTNDLIVASQASIQLANIRGLAVASQASIVQLNVGSLMNASGASLNGFPIVPTFTIIGPVSLATTSIGRPVNMPIPASIEWMSVITRTPVSGASLVLDVNKNFTSIFTDQNTRLSILGGGTFASTASIGTKLFNQGDVFSVDFDNGGGSAQDFIIQFRAR